LPPKEGFLEASHRFIGGSFSIRKDIAGADSTPHRAARIYLAASFSLSEFGSSRLFAVIFSVVLMYVAGGLVSMPDQPGKMAV
jgi:hypothetical protein